MKKYIIVFSLMVFAFIATNTVFAQNQYNVEVRWANDPAWHSQGTWVIGGRTNQHPIELRFASGNGADKTDGGKTFMGQVKYDQKEGMLSLKALRTEDNTFSVVTKKGNNDWINDGNWVIGGRENQGVVKFDAKSTDGGKTLTGKMTYAGEGPIEFKATMINTSNKNSMSSTENDNSNTASTQNDSACSKTLNQNPVNVNWVNKTGSVMVVHWINYDCNEGEGQEVQPGQAFQGTSYAGHVFRIVKGPQSDDPGIELITVGPSTASMPITWSR